MATLSQKRPSISNWFSSLRRQPKNKKSASISSSIGSGFDKQYQRSCIDLSSNSTFYVTPDKKQQQQQQPLSPTASVIDNTDDDDRRGLVTGKRVSQFCSQCCCHIRPPPTRSNSPVKLKKDGSQKQSPLSITTPSSQTPPYSTVATFNIPPGSPTSPSGGVSTLSSQFEIATDVSKDVRIMRLPSNESNTILYNKRSEYKRTTTTKTTRTLVITRPVELVLNDRGEMVTRQRTLEKGRSSSLGCVLDDTDGAVSDIDGDSCNSYSPRATTLHDSGANVGSMESGGEFKFIDDSSTSQSENERNSQNNVPTLSNNTKNSTSASQNNNNNKNNHIINSSPNSNNNNDDLCDVCKNVLQQNRNNLAHNDDAVILRNPLRKV